MTSNDSKISLGCNKNVLLSTEDQVIRAVTLRALDCVQSNYSFASANNDNEKFKQMFPDSKIAQSYRQGEMKVKYVIQFGIAPFVKEQMIRDFKLQPFTFKFDETTADQVKKQYDGYVQFWSNEKKEIVNKFLYQYQMPNYCLIILVVVNNTISNYTKIKFRSFFLGYTPNGNCVITLLDKLTK